MINDWEIIDHLTDYVLSTLRTQGKTTEQATDLIGDLMQSLGSRMFEYLGAKTEES